MSSDDEHNIRMCIKRIDYSEEEEDEDDEEQYIDLSELSCINNNYEETMTVFMILRTDRKINMYRNTYSYNELVRLTSLFNKVDIFTKLFDSMYDIDEYIVSYEFIKDKSLEIKFNIKLNDLINESFTLNLIHSKSIDIKTQINDYEIDDDYEEVAY
tara:strand:+ start:740 stop:1210 length:471 start_codon:yes stop_codon:yes gene_type:complete